MRLAPIAASITAALVVAASASAAPVSFRGLECDALGSAAGLVWSPRSNVALYRVSNIGSSGQDGAVTTLPMECDGWQCAFGARPPGTAACDQVSLRFLASSAPGTPPFATFTQAASPGGAQCALDCPSASRYVVQVWSGTELVHSVASASPPAVVLPGGVTIADSGVAVSAGNVINNMRTRLDELESKAHRAGATRGRGGATVDGGRQRVVSLETRLINLGLLGVNGVAVTGDRFRISADVALEFTYRRIEIEAACLAGGGGFSFGNHGVHARKGLNAVNVKLACCLNDGALLSPVLPGPASRVTVGPGMANWRVTCGDLLLPDAALHAWGADFALPSEQELAAGGTLECRVPSVWGVTPDTLRVTALDDGGGGGPALVLDNADASKGIDVRAYSGGAFVTLSSSALVVPVNHPPLGFHAAMADGELLVRCPMPAGSFTTLGGMLHPCDSLEFRVWRQNVLDGKVDRILPCALTGHALDHLDLTQFAGVRKDQYLNAGGVVIVLDGDARIQPLGGDLVIHGMSEAGGDGASFVTGTTGVRVPLKDQFNNGDIPDQQGLTARAIAADGGLEDVASLDWVESTRSDGLSHVAMTATFEHQAGGRVFVELSDGTTCDPADLDSDGDGLMDFRALVAGTTSILGSSGYRRDSPWTECFDVAFRSEVAAKVRAVDRYLIGLRVWRNHGGEHVGTAAPEPVCVSLNGLPPGVPVTGAQGVCDRVVGWPHMHSPGTHIEAHDTGSTIDGFPVTSTWALVEGGADADVECVADPNGTGLSLRKRQYAPVTFTKRFGIGVGTPEPPLRGCAFTAELEAAADAGDAATLEMTLGGAVGGLPVPSLVSLYLSRRGYQYYLAMSDMAAAGTVANPRHVQVFSGGGLQLAFDTPDSLRFTRPPGSVVCIADDGTGRPSVALAGFAAGNVLVLQNGDVPCDRVTIGPVGTCDPSTFDGTCVVALNGLPPGVPVTGLRLAGVPTADAFLGVGPGPAAAVFALARPSPNPAQGTVGTSFALPAAARVCARVYDVAGRTVATLADARFTAGTHALRWDGRLAGGAPAPAGLYFLRVTRDGVEARTARFTRLR